jgi:hypothetical protein
MLTALLIIGVGVPVASGLGLAYILSIEGHLNRRVRRRAARRLARVEAETRIVPAE